MLLMSFAAKFQNGTQRSPALSIEHISMQQSALRQGSIVALVVRLSKVTELQSQVAIHPQKAASIYTSILP